jgi:ribosomal protein S6
MSNEVETQDSDFEPRVYEIGYLIVPSVAQEKLQDKAAALGQLITKQGGAILEQGEPQFRDLAYDMATSVANKKVVHKTGYFGWIKFEVDPALTAKIEEDLKKDTDLIRYMFIKTVRDNTLAPAQAVLTAEAEEKARKEREKNAPVKEAPAVAKKETSDEPVSKEEIDDTIDKLIVD